MNVDREFVLQKPNASEDVRVKAHGLSARIARFEQRLAGAVTDTMIAWSAGIEPSLEPLSNDEFRSLFDSVADAVDNLGGKCRVSVDLVEWRFEGEPHITRLTWKELERELKRGELQVVR